MYHNSMMEEEIDIEEHDVMDNPRIKHMFPDLTKVKTEVLDEDEEVGELPDIHYIHGNDCLQYENDYDYNEHDDLNYIVEDVEVENYTNKILLGSKPCTNKIEEKSVKKEYLPAVIMLEDWGDRLNNSSCFCKDCKILFATNNALDYHKMAAHSFLVAITNKAVKSTARSSTSHMRDVDKIEDGTVTPEKVGNEIIVENNKLCNHCNKYFPDGNTLIKHLYELLTKGDAKIDQKKSPKVANYNYQCRICQKVFLSYHGGKVHIKAVHSEECADEEHIIKVGELTEKTNTDFNVPNVPKRNKSNFQVTLDSDNNLDYWYSTRGFIRNPPIPQSILYKCVNCSIHFVMALQAIHHSTHCSKNSQYFRCEICKRKMRCHDILLHKLQHKVSMEFKIYQGSSRNYKKTLCKCPKCNICYSDGKFWLHYKVCSGKRLNCDWCKICGEFIHSHIAINHMNLHKTSSSVKNDFIFIKFATDVHIKFEENVERTVTGQKRKHSVDITVPLKKIKKTRKKRDIFNLYYCKFCNCCIHKNRWGSHVSNNCRKAKNIVCLICGLTFTQKSMVKHKELHRHYNVTLHDFKIFACNGSRTVPKAPHFYQCYKCKVFFATRLQREQHTCCDKYEICHICSKKFDTHAFILHNPFHTYGKTDKAVQPVTSYKPVQPVNIYKAGQSVTTYKPVQPVTTEKSLQRVTTDSVKKYNCLNEMWNILFLCESCGLNTDSYDEAVSHSQYHLVGSTDTIEQVRCKVCDMKFDYKCYKNHLQLHKQLPVSKNDFLILPYRSRALFKNQWFNLFGKLAPRRVQQIISQSIYKVTRRAKLRMVKNGRADYTLYVCNSCNVCVKGQDINKHLRIPCSRSEHYLDCPYCEIFFDNNENYNRHEKLHKKIDIEFRVVKFEPMETVKPFSVSRSKNCEVSYEKWFIFYKCAYCKLSVLCKGAQVKNHVCYDGLLATCKLCGLAYRAKYRPNHMRLHNKYPMLSRETVKCQLFHPENVEQVERVANEKMLTSKTYIVDCKVCRLFFKNRRELTAHYPECIGRVDETVAKVDETVARVDKTVARVDDRVARVDKTVAGVDETVARVDQPPNETVFMLYKCSKCPCHFVHGKSLKMHKRTCQPMRHSLHTCELCGLKFTQISLTKHKLKHHSDKKYCFKILEPDSGEILVYNG